MDWTDTKKQADAIENAIVNEWRIQQGHAGPIDAGLAGLLSGLSFGRTEGDYSARLRGAHPLAYRVGQYSPAIAAATVTGGLPIAAGIAGAALFGEPAVQQAYNDNVAPKPYPVWQNRLADSPKGDSGYGNMGDNITAHRRQQERDAQRADQSRIQGDARASRESGFNALMDDWKRRDIDAIRGVFQEHKPGDF